MKRPLKIIVASIMLSTMIINCEMPQTLGSPAECLDTRFEEYTIIGNGDRICTYYELYEYEGEYWTVWNCCVCDYIAMAFNCDNKMLCAFDEDCMNDFFDHATSVLFFTSDE